VIKRNRSNDLLPEKKKTKMSRKTLDNIPDFVKDVCSPEDPEDLFELLEKLGKGFVNYVSFASELVFVLMKNV